MPHEFDHGPAILALPRAINHCNSLIYNEKRAAPSDSTSILPFLVPCTIGQVSASSQNDLAGSTETEEGMTMEGAYEVWMGQPVILRVVAGNLRVPLRGRLLSETSDVVRLRIADSWDVDIFKTMVVGVEHDNPVYVLN